MKKIILILLPLFISSCGMFGSNSGGGQTARSVDQGSTALCEAGYWAPNGYQNCTSCSSITNSTGNSSADRKQCECNTNYSWNYGYCVTWSTTECAIGTWSASGYEPTGSSCFTCPDPSNNGTSTSVAINGLYTSCACANGYTWLNGSCESGGNNNNNNNNSSGDTFDIMQLIYTSII